MLNFPFIIIPVEFLTGWSKDLAASGLGATKCAQSISSLIASDQPRYQAGKVSELMFACKALCQDECWNTGKNAMRARPLITHAIRKLQMVDKNIPMASVRVDELRVDEKDPYTSNVLVPFKSLSDWHTELIHVGAAHGQTAQEMSEALSDPMLQETSKLMPALVQSALGISFGSCWNEGTHAKKHRTNLIATVKRFQEISSENGLPDAAAPSVTSKSSDINMENLRDKWKLVDGDCREGANGLLTYHLDAFDEGVRVAMAAHAIAFFASPAMGETLLPCPKCGGTNLIEESTAAAEISGTGYQSCWIECFCGAEGPCVELNDGPGPSEYQLVRDAWNRYAALAMAGSAARSRITPHQHETLSLLVTDPAFSSLSPDLQRRITDFAQSVKNG